MWWTFEMTNSNVFGFVDIVITLTLFLMAARTDVQQMVFGN